MNSCKGDLFSLDPSNRLSVTLDDNLQTQSQNIFANIREDIFTIYLKRSIWKVLCKRKLSSSDRMDMADVIKLILDEYGVRQIIVGIVLKLSEKKKRNCQNQSKVRSKDYESVDSVRIARLAWEDGINEELHTICAEAMRPFTVVRAMLSRNPLLEMNLGQSGPIESVKFLFDSEDLMETGVAIMNYNSRRRYHDRNIGLINLEFETFNWQCISVRFAEFVSCSMPQLGLDELTALYGSKLCTMRHDEAESICASGSMFDARYFMRRGVPPSMRCKVWRVALGLGEELSIGEEQTFCRLRRECDFLDLLTDDLFLHDIQTVTDDSRFFVFEEELKEVIFAFSRDEWVRSNCQYEIHKPIVRHDCVDLPLGMSSPPCGFQPFLGFASYTAPLCYIFRNKASLLSVSKVLFCRLWCKLNVLNSDADTLLTVCRSFECMLMQANPQLFLHLLGIGLQPMKVAFPWIQLGFTSLLEMEQLLHLWDRLIGFMDPLILAIAAAAIFVYRTESLMNCVSELEAIAVLNEGSRLHIIPIIQMFFLKEVA